MLHASSLTCSCASACESLMRNPSHHADLPLERTASLLTTTRAATLKCCHTQSLPWGHLRMPDSPCGSLQLVKVVHYEGGCH